MESIKAKDITFFIRLFIKWTLLSLLIGTIGGGIGSIFVLGVEKVNIIWQNHKWLVYFLPIIGISITFIYHKFNFKNPKGTNRIFEKIRSDGELSISVAPVIFASTILTHIGGGSAGREGAAVQIGGSLGSGIAKRLSLDDKDTSILVITGVTAVFTALFGTPATAIFFALEVTSVGTMYYAGLFPCFIAAVTAASVGKICNIHYMDFAYIKILPFDIFTSLKVAAVGVVSAVVSIVIVTTFSKVKTFSKKIIGNDFKRIAVGGAILIALTFIFSSGRYNGSGEKILYDAFNGEGFYYDGILKLIFTAITLGFGFKGGEIIPTFIIGATSGAIAGEMLALPVDMSAALGMIGVFCGAVNCPVASLILAMELFGGQGILYFLCICTFSYVFSGYYSLYSSQKIVYSKFKAKLLNIHAKH